MIEQLLAGPRVLYRYGGSNSPVEGLDCSGLVLWGCNQLRPPLLLGRPDTDALWRDLVESGFVDALVPEARGGAGLS